MSRFSTRRSRVSIAVAGIALSALALSACAGDTSDEPAATTDSDTSADSFGDITVQLSWIKNEEFAGEYFADSQGYYTEAGFETVTLVPGPSTGVAELVSGTADVALSDAVSIGAAVASEGAPLKIIGTTFQKNPFTILSLADGGDMSSVDDLIGKRIGVQDSNTTLFNAFLAANGVDPSELEVVPVQYDPAPLINGEVDGFMAYLTNEAISVEMEGLETANVPFADNGLPFVAEVFAVTDEQISSNRELLKAFLTAELRGWMDSVQDPEESARLAVEEYGADLDLDYDKALAGAIAQNLLIVTEETDANGLFTISDALQTETLASLASAGIELEADDLFDLSLLDEVFEESPELLDFSG